MTLPDEFTFICDGRRHYASMKLDKCCLVTWDGCIQGLTYSGLWAEEMVECDTWIIVKGDQHE